MDEYKYFDIKDEGERIPTGYQQIPLIWTFAVKFDGRRRARCVAGGHKTKDLEEDLYSGVVNLESVCLALVSVALMGLKLIAADIG